MGSRQGHVGKKRAVAIGAIAAGALLVVVQASAGSSAEDRPEFKPPQRAASIKGVGASLQEVVRRRGRAARRRCPGLARTSGVDVTASGVRVIVVPRSSAVGAAKTAVASHGGVVERSAAGLVQALVPVGDLEALASDPSVSLVRRPYLHAADVVTGEESAAMNAAGYTNAGYDGTGVKIGIIDGGFAGYAGQAWYRAARVGDDRRLLRRGLTTATEHGTAVAEIVHEVHRVPSST